MGYTVWSLGQGWYDFKDLPPKQDSIVLFTDRHCGTDDKAIGLARCWLKDNDATIIIKPMHENA